MKTKITYNTKAQDGLLEGINMIADAVKVTLGAKGRNVLIESLFGGAPQITKDGVTVAKAIDVEDSLQSQGVKLMQQVASNTNNEVGDGSSTSTILAQAIMTEGLEQVKKGTNPVYLQRGINKAVEKVCENLDKQTIKVENNPEFIKQIATISANNDEKLGTYIADAFEKVGKYGAIKIAPSKNSKTHLEYSSGMVFDSGLIDMHFLDPDKRKMIFDNNIRILVTDHKLNDTNDFAKDGKSFLNVMLAEKKTLIIICEAIESTALRTLITLRKMQGGTIFVVKAPGYGEERAEILQDIAILTGATFIRQGEGMKLEDVTEKELGSCKVFETDTETSKIIEGAGERGEIEKRIVDIEKEAETLEHDYEIDKYKERVAKLDGGIATLYLGAKSEVEVSELKDRVEDAVNATKAAIEGGVVAGGGIALLNSKVNIPEGLTEEEKIGMELINKIISAPFNCIVKNAGENPVEILKTIQVNPPKWWEILWYSIILQGTPPSIVSGRLSANNYGYDVKNNKFGDMYMMGILDPVKVTKIALQNAASVAGTLLTTSCVITNIDRDAGDGKFSM